MSHIKSFSLLATVSFLASSCLNLDRFSYSPPLKASEWCQQQPCSECFGLTISQPSSSVIVYFLSFYTLWIACYFYATKAEEKSRFWWAISLLFGGLGALFAGTSFQAFGYEIKCTGQEFCQLTSWWEIIYNIFTVIAAGTLLIAVSYSSLSKKGQYWSKIYASMSGLLYTVTCFYGIQIGEPFLVSFDFMILSSLPPYLFIIPLHVYHYSQTPSPLIKNYLICWFLFLVVIIGYSAYLNLGLTQMLWAKGIWFSENDVLHVLMLLWCFYTHFYLAKWVKDRLI